MKGETDLHSCFTYAVQALSAATLGISTYSGSGGLLSALDGIKGRDDRITYTVRTTVGSPDRSRVESYAWAAYAPVAVSCSGASWRDARVLRLLRSRWEMGDEDPVVSLRSTTGYRLASLRLALEFGHLSLNSRTLIG